MGLKEAFLRQNKGERVTPSCSPRNLLSLTEVGEKPPAACPTVAVPSRDQQTPDENHPSGPCFQLRRPAVTSLLVISDLISGAYRLHVITNSNNSTN